MTKYNAWITGNSKIVNDRDAPNINKSGINTTNSRIELTKADITILKVRTSRGIKILVTRLGLPTIEPMATIVPFAKKRHAIIPIKRYKAKCSCSNLKMLLNTTYNTSIIRSGFNIDQAKPRNELWYFTLRSLATRFFINSLYSNRYMPGFLR